LLLFVHKKKTFLVLFYPKAYIALMPNDIAPQFRLTDRAATRIAEIVAAEGGAQSLRVAVLAGGCSGFQYKFELDRTQAEDDVVIAHDGATVLIDPASLDLLAGSELDYTDSLMGSHFAVKNPQAVSACGCGTSFSVD
jgi:iron-sulfur cluster insertion protein